MIYGYICVSGRKSELRETIEGMINAGASRIYIDREPVPRDDGELAKLLHVVERGDLVIIDESEIARHSGTSLDEVTKIVSEKSAELNCLPREESNLASVAGIADISGTVCRYFPPNQRAEARRLRDDGSMSVSDIAGLFDVDPDVIRKL